MSSSNASKASVRHRFKARGWGGVVTSFLAASDGLACFGAMTEAGLDSPAPRRGRASHLLVAAVQVVEPDIEQYEDQLV